MPLNDRKVYQTPSGVSYTYDWSLKSRTAFAEFMNPATRYERVYYQIDVYDSEGKFVNFAFVDDVTDTESVVKALNGVVEWHNTPAHVLEKMHSRFD